MEQLFPNLTPSQIEQLKHFASLVLEWNKYINLISRKDIDNLLTYHIPHCLSLLLYFDIPPQALVLDLGTGGGFPGIPLAIVYPQVQFRLVDSIAKKINAVDSIVKHLQLKNVQIQRARAEDLKQEYDIVVSRGVAKLEQLWHWTKPLLKRSKNFNCNQDLNTLSTKIELTTGLVAYKGYPFDEDLGDLQAQIGIFPLKDRIRNDLFAAKSLVLIH